MLNQNQFQITKNSVLYAMTLLIKEDKTFLYEDVMGFNSFIKGNSNIVYDSDIDDCFNLIEVGDVDSFLVRTSAISFTDNDKAAGSFLIKEFSPEYTGVSQDQINNMLSNSH